MRTCLIVIAALTAASAMCQTARVYAGWEQGSHLNGDFDPDRVFVFTGRVIGVDISAPSEAVEPGVAVIVRLGDGRSVLVDLGPKWFLEDHGLKVRMGDVVEIAGAKTFDGGWRSYIASRMRRGALRLALRTVEGRPLWTGEADSPH